NATASTSNMVFASFIIRPFTQDGLESSLRSACGTRSFLRVLAGFDIVVPELVMLLGPSLINCAVTHRLGS
ncbi:MAG: hypothetical protein ACREUJ_06305, partial [Burkholderiales bacterium]